MSVALDSIKWQTVYPMDYYSNDSLGPWTNNNEAYRPVRQRKPRPMISSKGDQYVTKANNKEDKSISEGDNLVSDKTDNEVMECSCKNADLQTDTSKSVLKEDKSESALQSDILSRQETNSCCTASSENSCCTGSVTKS